MARTSTSKNNATNVTMEELMSMMNQMIHNMDKIMDAYLAAEKTTTQSVKAQSVKAQSARTKSTIKSTTRSAKKSAPKQPVGSTSGKKSTWTPREQYLTEKYGDIETRKNYISVKKEVAAEMLSEAKATGNYWKKTEYGKELQKRVNERMGKANA